MQLGALIVLADDITDPDRHDARVLMDLATIHAAAPLQHLQATVVVELLGYRSVALARAYGRLAAVVSSQLVSNYLVQLAVEPDRATVFEELLSPEGCEIHVRPVEWFIRRLDERVTFDDLFARARSIGAILIGYIPPGDRPEELLPPDRARPHPASHYCNLVVVSEE